MTSFVTRKVNGNIKKWFYSDFSISSCLEQRDTKANNLRQVKRIDAQQAPIDRVSFFEFLVLRSILSDHVTIIIANFNIYICENDNGDEVCLLTYVLKMKKSC